MSFFRIITPNYNNAEWLEKCLTSVKEQTFTDYHFIFIDDVSTDDSMQKALEYSPEGSTIVGLNTKHWNGGSRNFALNMHEDDEYTLFLDSDDWFIAPDVLQELHDFIIEHGRPDCIRLPYKISYNGNKIVTVMLDDDNAEKLVNSIFVASWTKCVKSSLIVPFAENTLMEDVVQHIKQCDIIDYNVAVFNKPVVMYNKNNTNSCSAKRNMDAQNHKWKSSMYRFMADLLDLELEHDYCIKARDKRAAKCLGHIKNDEYIQ